jgi:hypothetical protein
LALPFYRSLDDLVPHVIEPKDLWWVVLRRTFADSHLPQDLPNQGPPGLFSR